MADYPYYDEDPRRNAKKRRRRYEDDAWGQAEYEDYADGDFASAEDYAGGMVDEVGGKKRFYNPDRYDDGGYTAPNSAVGSDWRSEHIGTSSSDGVERASELWAKLNERNSVRGRARPSAPRGLPPKQSTSDSPSRHRPRMRNATEPAPAVGFTFALMFMATILMISCVALTLYAFFG